MWKTKCRRQGKVGRGKDDGAKIGMGAGRAAMMLTPGMRFPLKLLPILAGDRGVRTGVFVVQMGKWGMRFPAAFWAVWEFPVWGHLCTFQPSSLQSCLQFRTHHCVCVKPAAVFHCFKSVFAGNS